MPETLAEVYDAIREEHAFGHLRSAGIALVPGEGGSRPDMLIVGEAPGATENTARRPFVGASGRVLRSLIDTVAELTPEEYFITNVIKYRPPGNRTPFDGEIRNAVPYLRREWKALQCPRILVAVGGTALKALAPGSPTVTRAAGKPQMLSGGRILWPMYHPAYGLRNPQAQPTMEQHWTEFGRWYRKEFPYVPGDD